jgi:hypothetical protein
MKIRSIESYELYISTEGQSFHKLWEDREKVKNLRRWPAHLLRAACLVIQELQGDVLKEAIDIYDHVDKKELRESYLAHIPQLGI